MANIIRKQKNRFDVEYSLIPPFPKTIFLDLSNHCNHKCFFCGNSEMPNKRAMDFKFAKRILKELRINGSTDIGLYARGEPFVYPKLKEIMSEAKNIGFPYIFLTTNGALASPAKLEPILRAGLDSIKFSINAGMRKSYRLVHGKDDFNSVINNIKWCSDFRKKTGLKYKIYASMVPSSLLEKNEDAVLKKIFSECVDDFQIRHCSNQGGNKIENNKTESIDKNNLLGSLRSDQSFSGGCCPDPFGRATITPEGYMSACVVDYQNLLVVADLNIMSVKEAWECKLFKELRRRHMEKKLKGLICFNCLNNVDNQAMPLNAELSKKINENNCRK
jgi:MoaA/NifB/PqqE/SkfB family radical SAM enzyme